MNKTVVLAKANSVLVGAHPSLPDLQGFGRREMAVEPVRRLALPRSSTGAGIDLSLSPKDELASCFIYQVGALDGFLKRHGLPLNHVRTPTL